MQHPILTKNQLDSQLGHKSKWFPKILTGLSYISGLDFFDEIVSNKNDRWTKTSEIINIHSRPNGIEIEILQNFKYNSIGINLENISAISLEDKEQMFEQAEKSVIGRAIIGGILLGPAGAIVGGISGVGSKEIKAKMPDLLLVLQFASGNAPIVLSCEYKKRSEVVNFLKKHLDQVTLDI
jgi:hypothetical protein